MGGALQAAGWGFLAGFALVVGALVAFSARKGERNPVNYDDVLKRAVVPTPLKLTYGMSNANNFANSTGCS